MHANVTIDTSTDKGHEAAKELVNYANKHGHLLEVERKGDTLSVRVSVSKQEGAQTDKHNIALANAAQMGDNHAVGVLADKLEEVGHPLARPMRKAQQSDNPSAEAARAIKNYVIAYGSLNAPRGAGKRAHESATRRRWSVTEAYSRDAQEHKVDKEIGVIYNVLILGKRSKNKRRYLTTAMEDAVRRGKYERLQVYIGPHKRSKWAKRSPDEHVGELIRTRVAPDGIRGDLRYNRASHGGQLMLEIAERFPGSFGLSHHADIAGYEEGDEKIVTRILEVAVADVVKDPGTTETVFEEQDPVLREEPGMDGNEAAEDDGEDDGEADGWEGCYKKLVAEIHNDDDVDDETKLAATKLLMKLKALLSGENEDDEDAEEDAEDNEYDDGEESAQATAKKQAKGKKQAAVADPRYITRRDFKRMSKQLAKTVTEAVANKPPAQKRPPKSTARSEATESVEEAAAKKRTADKATLPKGAKAILAAYSDEDE
jgi:hypothetical protein